MDDLVKRLRERLEKATAGPWECNNNVGVVFGDGCHVAKCGDFHDQELVPYNAERWAADAHLIADLKTSAPALLDELEALRADLARVRALQSSLDDALRRAGPIHAGPVPGALGQKYPRARQCVIEFEDGSGAYDLQMVLATVRAALAAWSGEKG